MGTQRGDSWAQDDLGAGHTWTGAQGPGDLLQAQVSLVSQPRVCRDSGLASVLSSPDSLKLMACLLCVLNGEKFLSPCTGSGEPPTPAVTTARAQR